MKHFRYSNYGMAAHFWQRLEYSVGAVYLTVLNLPGPVRNKIHNICLVGILPGPHEPSHDINSFIDALSYGPPPVSEWSGINNNNIIWKWKTKDTLCYSVCIM